MNRGFRSVTMTALIALSAAGCSQGNFLTDWFRGDDGDEARAADQRTAQPNELLIALGDAAMARGEAETASAYYRRALESNRNDAIVQARLGHALLAQRRFGQAEMAFRQALAVDGELANALYGLGKLYIMRDNAAEAAQHFSRAIASAQSQGQSGVYRLYNGLGIALDMQGDHNGAQMAYQEGLNDAPDSLTLRNNLGLSLAAVGRYDDAIAVLYDVANDQRATARHRQNLAMVYGLAGRDDDAANVSFRDLGRSEVESNLAYYSWLRRLRAQS